MRKSIQIFIIAILAFAAFEQWSLGSEVAQGFSGNWEVRYGCSKVSDVNKKICQEGMQDSFRILNMTQTEEKVCGYHLATGNLRRRVDEGGLDGHVPSIYGVINHGVAIVSFRSGLTGEVGKAKIERKPGVLIWNIVKPLEGESWFPMHATLHPLTKGVTYHRTNCDQVQ